MSETNKDILMELDLETEVQKLSEDNTKRKILEEDEKINEIKQLDIQKEIEKLQNQAKTNKTEEINKQEIEQRTKKRIHKRKTHYFLSWIIFFSKYLITSVLIFTVLLVSTNYHAYINIAKSYIYSNQMEVAEQRLVTSVEASNIKEKYESKAKEKLRSSIDITKTDKENNSKLSLKHLKKKKDKKGIKLSIDITPYENRVIIPKIWKNIPLIDIKNKKISWKDELNDIFMKELEDGIVRYPGSAKPWENWTSFIFWHSSNFPWIKWDYNDVFATLDNVSYWDEVIVYYWQEKYTYQIKEKKVIKPGDVSVLNRNKGKSEITLMTCWPIWTTLNRLIVVWELVKNN